MKHMSLNKDSINQYAVIFEHGGKIHVAASSEENARKIVAKYYPGSKIKTITYIKILDDSLKKYKVGKYVVTAKDAVQAARIVSKMSVSTASVSDSSVMIPRGAIGLGSNSSIKGYESRFGVKIDANDYQVSVSGSRDSLLKFIEYMIPKNSQESIKGHIRDAVVVSASTNATLALVKDAGSGRFAVAMSESSSQYDGRHRFLGNGGRSWVQGGSGVVDIFNTREEAEKRAKEQLPRYKAFVVSADVAKKPWVRDSASTNATLAALAKDEEAATDAYDVAIENLRGNVEPNVIEVLLAIRDDERRHLENLYAAINGTVTEKNLEDSTTNDGLRFEEIESQLIKAQNEAKNKQWSAVSMRCEDIIATIKAKILR